MTIKSHSRFPRARGFTLLEALVATLVMATGVLSLAFVLADSLAYMNMSQYEFICQQKAQEAVESVFTARDAGFVTWGQIDNISNGGIFKDGPQPLLDPGPDGMVNTADDNPLLPDAIVGPGPDGILGTDDDTKIYLSNFSRQMTIVDNVFGNPNLKQITVTVTYTQGRFQRTYNLVTYISSFS
jgi:type II secretory pathway pseudopilin PulG